jgi:methylated-DNA-protein-cysteine methyltransferase-like protein
MESTPVEGLAAADRILAAIRAIPRGEVAGYGHVARRAGLPGRARLVARLLAGNEDATLPWHRVLRSDGRIAFPPGSKGFREQARRLRAEGVIVEKGRVRIRPVEADDLDAALWRMR